MLMEIRHSVSDKTRPRFLYTDQETGHSIFFFRFIGGALVWHLAIILVMT